MNTLDWLNATAEFLALDRPDLYDVDEARNELLHCMEVLRKDINTFSIISFSSYILMRLEDEGIEEFTLSRKLAGLSIFPEEEVVTVISYDPRIDLPDTLDL